MATKKQGVFGCFEVTIGWFGKERVDYMTCDTKGIWRCYEIKVTVADFRSKAHNTFLGHYNYYVMTKELYDKIKDEIPNHIGVYIGGASVKKAKKQDLCIDEEILKNSLIRSLSRETEKIFRSENPVLLNSINRQLNNEKREKEKYRSLYWELLRNVEEKYGTRWNK